MPGSLRQILGRFLAHSKRSLVRSLIRFRIVWIMLLAGLMLSGCVRYETGITFNTANRGTIVQHIQLSSQLTALNGGDLQRWWRDLERQARSLQGRVVKLSNRDVVVTIPFYGGPDLVEKFETFLAPLNTSLPEAGTLLPDLPTLPFQFDLNQQNFLFLIRNRLSYDLDLTELDPSSSVAAGSSLLNGAISDLVTLKLRLTTPWGAQAIVTDSSPSVQSASFVLASTTAPEAAASSSAGSAAPAAAATDSTSSEPSAPASATQLPDPSEPSPASTDTAADQPDAKFSPTEAAEKPIAPNEKSSPMEAAEEAAKEPIAPNGKSSPIEAAKEPDASTSEAATSEPQVPKATPPDATQPESPQADIPKSSPEPTPASKEDSATPTAPESKESAPSPAPEEAGPKILSPTQQDNSLVWTLVPGRVNHLEAVFWLPNPIGIGSALIVLGIVAGYTLKYGIPGRSSASN